MIYDVYEMAVLYKLERGPQNVASLYCNSSQKRRLNGMFDAGMIAV